MSKQKLELMWIGKGEDPKLEPRILLFDKEKSYGDANTENMLIHGDNLLALKALEQDYEKKIKCIYIDPPYNIDAMNEHYDDFVEHSKWLSTMTPRLKILHNLLCKEGSIWIQINDEEQAYLKVLCDEIFGRSNFINMISVNMKNNAGASGGGEDKRLKKNCEYILVYAKDYNSLLPFSNSYDYTEIYNVVEKYRVEGKNWHYTSVLVDKGEKVYIGSTVDGGDNEIKVYRRKGAVVKSINQVSKDEGITEKEVYYKYGESIFEAKDAQSSIRIRVIEAKKKFSITDDIISIEYVPKTGRNKGILYEQFYKGDKCRLFAWLKDISETIDGVLYKKDLQGTYWDFTSSINNLTKEGSVVFPSGKKPEALLNRIYSMATSEGDLVLDSFLGSGTTAAVAHKMNRRWIGIELGNHVYSHCKARLDKVIGGSDDGGITKVVNWKGGGGYKFYELAPSLLKKDKYGNWVIDKDIYNPDMLAAAMCKHEGFTYDPDVEVFWRQGYSYEKDYIFTTTQFVSLEYLDLLHQEMSDDESLLICCQSFQQGADKRYENINIKKIPQVVLNKCDFGVANYNMNIIEVPEMDDEVSEDE